MKRGKRLILYLIDGDPTDRIKCKLDNRTSIAYKIPRTSIDKCKNIPHLEQSGIYFLFGTDHELNDIVYVGQACVRKNKNGVLSRILEPHDTIDWNEAIIYTTADHSFGLTEISYLEHRFYNIITDAKRYTVVNINNPTEGDPVEEIKSAMEDHIDDARIIFPALGHKLFEPITKPESKEDPDNELLLHMEYSGYKATGKRTNEGFVILKGSAVNPNLNKSCPANVIRFREKYGNQIDKATCTLTETILLSSPSAAAGFIGGCSLSGNILWKDEKGTSLKKLEQSSLSQKQVLL